LQRKDVRITIDDEAGQEVAFAEDEAVGVGIVDDALAVGDGIGDALAEQCGEVGDRVAGDEADGDLGGAGIERRSEGFAAMVGNGDYIAGTGAIYGCDVGAVDPDVAGFQAGCAAGGEFNCRSHGRS
jgi:hypothetical protein